MREKVNLHIYAKACKSNKFGHLPIYIRLTVAGQRFEFSTKKFVNPTQWSAEKSRIKGTSEEACTINNYLEVIKNQIFDIELELVHQKLPKTIEAFKIKLAGAKPRARMLVPIFQDHNNRIKELIGREYAAGTLKHSYLELSILILSFAISIPIF